MVKQVNIHHAKTHLSALIQDVERGREVVIARAGKPVARLVAAETPRRDGRQRRDPSIVKGLIVKVADDFDAPLPAKLLKRFYK